MFAVLPSLKEGLGGDHFHISIFANTYDYGQAWHFASLLSTISAHASKELS
jgi:hypothetical protein